ncbi:hypothetical protein [Chryseobacterium turcicum]|uniref:Uncharacterized protein n=1 Tax=Chryseobacterium turcicum TaxID=2898076 RepID=A0A9Q3V3G1_9FLAO|nr:hypothetical protein [Chryseobacterium turcicum]MCD1115975.1 hypothetical protein [Chryseobacterium turcicum]
MGKILRNININVNEVNLNLSLHRFCIYVTFIFSFFCSNAYAQVEIETSAPQATIILKQGATIFSTDASFNQQINSDKITIKNADVSTSEIHSNAQILTGRLNKIPEAETLKKTFRNDVKIALENKNKETLKKIKKEIADYKKRINPFKSENLRFPTSQEFTSATHTNRDYVAPSYNHHHFSKIHASQNQYVIKCALDFLHKQEYIYYNSKSLDYCFTHVFSVRPPPVLV